MLNILNDIGAMKELLSILPPTHTIRQWGERGKNNYALFRTINIPAQYRDSEIIPITVKPIVKGMNKEVAEKLLHEVMH